MVFEYSPVKMISGKKFISSHLQKFTPPSVLQSVHVRLFLTLCFASESFSFSWKKKEPMIGCSSELLDDNCIRVYLYEGYLVNFKVCVWFWCITCVGSRNQTRWSLLQRHPTTVFWDISVRSPHFPENGRWVPLLLVKKGCPNGNVCGPSCNKHKIYNPHKAEEQI